VLPAYNEAATLPELLAAIDRALFEAGLAYGVVLVDDGSGDDTAEIAARAAATLPLHLERHPVNLGLGATLRDGLLKAAELADSGDVVVTMDADNSHSPGLIARLVSAVREGHDVVIASRYRPGSRVVGVPLARRALSFWGSWLLRLCFPIRGVRDYTCGYRAYRAALWQRVVARDGAGFFEQDGFQSMVDILLKLRRERDLLFGEVAVILRYDRKEGPSKMRVLATIRKTLALLDRRRLGVR
jgi:dolichol-phosphate mannosyltransferase